MQTLDEVDPNAYPHAVADWSRAEAYPDHGGDATKYAWELTRRDRRFQLLSDVHRISYERETEFPRTHAVPDRIVAAIHGLPGIEDFVQQAAALDDPRVERLGTSDSGDRCRSTATPCPVAGLREWFAPFHTASEGAYREGLPPADRRVFDRGRTPPWPLHWPGKDAETQGAHALLDLVDYPAGLLREILLEMPDRERESCGGRAERLGRWTSTHKANAYSSTYWSGTAPPPEVRGRGSTVFPSVHEHRSAGRTRVRNARRHAAPSPASRSPSARCPYRRPGPGVASCDISTGRPKATAIVAVPAVEFKRAIGVKESNSTEWRRLRARVKEYTAGPGSACSAPVAGSDRSQSSSCRLTPIATAPHDDNPSAPTHLDRC